MTLCEKCIHREVCNIRDCHDEDDERALTYCTDFKNKADVVEVVRCKDCKHWIYWADCKYCTCDIHHSRNMTINDFCSYGEREDT